MCTVRTQLHILMYVCMCMLDGVKLCSCVGVYLRILCVQCAYTAAHCTYLCVCEVCVCVCACVRACVCACLLMELDGV